MSPTPEDRARVAELLGREPRGHYEIAVRDQSGDPVVLRNAPFLDDGTPMPTRYWLVGVDEQRRIGRLESDGAVDRAEAEIDPAEIAAAHARYAAERDADIPDDHTGPRPSGGVGGTRVGLKCLHAHWAWHLAGGDDPVGRWIEARLSAPPTVEVADDHTTVRFADGDTRRIPWGPNNLTDAWFDGQDPPRPSSLTNALGAIADHLDDLLRERPDLLDAPSLVFTGPTIASLARVEVGADDIEPEIELTRDAGEEIFRMVATDTAADRAFHPGLPADHVDVIVATCCIVLAFVRRLRHDVTSLHDVTSRASRQTPTDGPA